jgi:hypothetical protein
MTRFISGSLVALAALLIGGCAHTLPDFDGTYLPTVVAASPQKRIDLTKPLMDKVTVTTKRFLRSSVTTYHPVSIYWRDDNSIVVNVRNGDYFDTVLHSFLVNRSTGEIRPLTDDEKATQLSRLEKTKLVSTDTSLGDAAKAIFVLAIAIASRGSGGGGSFDSHYASAVDDNGTILNVKLSYQHKTYFGPFSPSYYDCKYSIKNDRTGKSMTARRYIEEDDVDYDLKDEAVRHEITDWLRAWRVSPDGRYYLNGKTATLVDSEDETFSTLIRDYRAKYPQLDINPSWDTVALLKVETREKKPVSYAIELYPFKYPKDKTAQGH